MSKLVYVAFLTLSLVLTAASVVYAALCIYDENYLGGFLGLLGVMAWTWHTVELYRFRQETKRFLP